METASRNGESDESGDGSTPVVRASGGRRMLTAALLVAMMVTAVEQLVVSPAMPTIIAQLKGFEIYPWVISAYLLAATVSTPIYGKLADLFGASGCCSSAWSFSPSARCFRERPTAWDS